MDITDKNTWCVEFYSSRAGNTPIEDFLDSVDIKTRAKIVRTIELLQKNGTALRMPYSEFLVDGIFELRIQAMGNAIRVLYFFFYEKRIVLTHGFYKKTKKTPQEQINLAIRYRDDFLGRNKK